MWEPSLSIDYHIVRGNAFNSPRKRRAQLRLGLDGVSAKTTAHFN